MRETVSVRLGEFVFDSASRELRGRAGPCHLSPKAFECLGALLERRPEAVRRAQLQDRLWPKTFVADTSLRRPQKLGAVRERDIQEWLNLDEVRQRVEGRQSAFLNIANDSRYYIAPGKVHMLRFAEAAHELLNSRR